MEPLTPAALPLAVRALSKSAGSTALLRGAGARRGGFRRAPVAPIQMAVDLNDKLPSSVSNCRARSANWRQIPSTPAPPAASAMIWFNASGNKERDYCR